MKVFALLITYPGGHVTMLTFSTAFDRALHMILLRAQPVQLAMAEY